MLEKAINLATNIKFFVKIDSEEIKELSYLELGFLLTTNSNEIKEVHILFKD